MKAKTTRGNKETDFGRHLEYFLKKYLPFERNMTASTVKSYRAVFIKFVLFMKDKMKIKPDKIKLSHLTRSNVQAFLNSIHEEGNTPSTCNHRLAVIWAFVKYLQYEEVQNMAQWQQILSINKMQTESPVIAYLSVEATKVLLSAQDCSTKGGRRHHLMLAMLYDLGLRVQELADLKVGDLRFYGKEINVRVMGKGRKGRIVPLMGVSVDTVRQYLDEWNLTAIEKADHPLFFNARHTKLTRSGISYILKTYLDACRKENPQLFPDPISCHKLRHSKAMHLLQSGVNLYYIRDLLGHSSEKTTEVYARVGSSFKDEALKKAYKGTTVETDTAPKWLEDPGLLEMLMSI